MAVTGTDYQIVEKEMVRIGVEFRTQHSGTRLYPKMSGFNEVLAGQLAKKLPLIHPILERLSPIDEHDGDFVIELPAKFQVGINVNLAPSESAVSRKF